jgi:hypothetical protein
MSNGNLIDGFLTKKSDQVLYDFSLTLKGTKTLKEIFAEAEKLYPCNEEAQCRHAAVTMKEIGFVVSTQVSGS